MYSRLHAGLTCASASSTENLRPFPSRWKLSLLTSSFIALPLINVLSSGSLRVRDRERGVLALKRIKSMVKLAEGLMGRKSIGLEPVGLVVLAIDGKRFQPSISAEWWQSFQSQPLNLYSPVILACLLSLLSPWCFTFGSEIWNSFGRTIKANLETRHLREASYIQWSIQTTSRLSLRA